MQQEIHEYKFLEHGEHNGNLYGTHMDSIRDVVSQGNKIIYFSRNLKLKIIILGKMCVLDCSPSALKILHSNPEFMPYVIFIGAPGMETLKQIYAERKATGGSQKNLAVSS